MAFATLTARRLKRHLPRAEATAVNAMSCSNELIACYRMRLYREPIGVRFNVVPVSLRLVALPAMGASWTRETKNSGTR